MNFTDCAGSVEQAQACLVTSDKLLSFNPKSYATRLSPHFLNFHDSVTVCSRTLNFLFNIICYYYASDYFFVENCLHNYKLFYVYKFKNWMNELNQLIKLKLSI